MKIFDGHVEVDGSYFRAHYIDHSVRQLALITLVGDNRQHHDLYDELAAKVRGTRYGATIALTTFNSEGELKEVFLSLMIDEASDTMPKRCIVRCGMVPFDDPDEGFRFDSTHQYAVLEGSDPGEFWAAITALAEADFDRIVQVLLRD